MKKLICSMVVATFMLTAASVASADCITGGKKASHSPLEALRHPGVMAYSESPAGGFEDSSPSIVGLWTVTFLVGDGPDVFDQGFEQWHADGTEITIDVAVPPAAGNICLGVWKGVGRAVKLHHVGWNWDTSVNPAALAGVFVLDMSVTVGRDGKTFSGRYVTDSYDNDGNVLPAYHAEGVVRGQRIGVN